MPSAPGGLSSSITRLGSNERRPKNPGLCGPQPAGLWSPDLVSEGPAARAHRSGGSPMSGAGEEPSGSCPHCGNGGWCEMRATWSPLLSAGGEGSTGSLVHLHPSPAHLSMTLPAAYLAVPGGRGDGAKCCALSVWHLAPLLLPWGPLVTSAAVLLVPGAGSTAGWALPWGTPAYPPTAL